jgi:hypothetical protein
MADSSVMEHTTATRKETTMPRFTATRTEHGKTRPVTRITVRDEDGNITDTTTSATMRYVEVSVSPAGKVVTRSSKRGGTRSSGIYTAVPVFDEDTQAANLATRAPDPAAVLRAMAEADAQAAEVTTGTVVAASQAEAKAAKRRAARAARKAALTPEQAEARKAARRARRAARKAAQG